MPTLHLYSKARVMMRLKKQLKESFRTVKINFSQARNLLGAKNPLFQMKLKIMLKLIVKLSMFRLNHQGLMITLLISERLPRN